MGNEIFPRLVFTLVLVAVFLLGVYSGKIEERNEWCDKLEWTDQGYSACMIKAVNRYREMVKQQQLKETYR